LRKYKEVKLNKEIKKELILYSIITIILVAFTIKNSIYWKIGRSEGINATQEKND
jgi:hypothetical protein